MTETNGRSALPAFVHFYDGSSPGVLKLEEMASFLKTMIPDIHVDIRKDFLLHWCEASGGEDSWKDRIAKNLACARVRTPSGHDETGKSLPGEVAFEFRFITSGGRKPCGILYGGYRLIEIYAAVLPPQEVDPVHCHIALTNQLFGTRDKGDLRYHARVAVYGIPSIISTAGIVEGPARPREFYIGLGLGAGREDLEKQLESRFLEPGDSRIQEALKGYVMQALFYHMTGNPFCEDKACRLFNAHWQEDLIHAQIEPGAGLCEKHHRFLEKWSCG